MRRSAWLVAMILFLACSSSSDSSSADLTGLWVVNATPTSTDGCDVGEVAYWTDVIQDSSDSFFTWGSWFGGSGKIDGTHATFTFPGSPCGFEFSANVSGDRFTGTMKYTCTDGGGCETDFRLSGERQVAAQAFCDKQVACGDTTDLESYIECIGQVGGSYMQLLDASPSQTAACVRALPASEGVCPDFSALDTCLDMDYPSWTCLDEGTLRIFGHGTHRDIDCHFYCYAYQNVPGGVCSGGACDCGSM